MAMILVIDDDPQLRKMLVRILISARNEMVEAKDGKEGLKRFRESKPALVITDMLMPEADGIEAIQELRREEPRPPIIAISGGGFTAVPEMFLEPAAKLGADLTLAKPFRAAELIEAVRKLLG